MDKSTNELWLKCPYCKRKTRTKVLENTLLLHYPLFCPWCRTEYIVSLVERGMTVERVPSK